MGNVDRAVLLKQMDRLHRDGTYTHQSDSQLLDRYLRSRDEGAFEAIVQLHGPLVLALCRRFLRDPRDIEDAFQATFLILARKAGSIRDRAVLSSWIYGVAYRVAVRARADVLRRRSLEMGVPLLDDFSAAVLPEPDETGLLLDQELNRLPEKYRAPIVLCYLNEQTHDQAAAALACPVGTVRSRLARGRALLKERLARRGCTQAAPLLGLTPGISIRSLTTAVPEPLVRATVAAAARALEMTGTGVRPALLSLISSGSPSLSGSATTLAQGVLTTMAVTQMKIIAAGLTTAGLLAGGLSAGAFALGSSGPGQQDAQPVPAQKTAPRTSVPPATPTPELDMIPAARPPVSVPGPGPGASGVETRLAELERKLDLLLERMGRPQAPAAGAQDLVFPFRTHGVVPNEPPPVSAVPSVNPPDSAPLQGPQTQGPQTQLPPARAEDLGPSDVVAPAVAQRQLPPVPVVLPMPATFDQLTGLPNPPPPPQDALNNLPLLERRVPALPRGNDVLGMMDSGHSSLREVNAQLDIAVAHFRRSKQLLDVGAIDREAYQKCLDDIRLLMAKLQGMGEDLSDELVRLKIELLKKQAELKLADSQRASTARTAASTKKMAEKKVVSPDEAAHAMDDLGAAEARVVIQRTEVQLAEMRMEQVERRKQAILQDLSEVLRIPELKQELGVRRRTAEPDQSRTGPTS